MNKEEIVRIRLQRQLVTASGCISPEEVVRHMVAIQAQDYRSSLWAIALRMYKPTSVSESAVEQAFANRRIVRTWPMRGTLHWVSAEDVRWMLRLLAPKVIKGAQGRHRELELDEPTLENARSLFENAMQGGISLSRSELYQLLERNGISPQGQRGIHIIGYWAMRGLLCQVPKKGKQYAFALLDDWIPNTGVIPEEEALAMLAGRYIQSRGPATEYDLANWAGLTLRQARVGLELASPHLASMVVEEDTYWLPQEDRMVSPSRDQEGVHLLPAFDEMLCGYKDRSALLTSAEMKSTILRNGIFKPLILLNKRAIGTWQRIIKPNYVLVSFSFFKPVRVKEKQLVRDCAMNLQPFFERDVCVASE